MLMTPLVPLVRNKSFIKHPTTKTWASMLFVSVFEWVVYFSFLQRGKRLEHNLSTFLPRRIGGSTRSLRLERYA